MSSSVTAEMPRSLDLTCPSCGAFFVPPPGGPRGQSPPSYVVIVRRPDGWEPASPLDAPPQGVVMDVVADLSLNDPATFVRQFNAACLDEGGSGWAALSGEVPRIGRPANLVRA